MTTIREGLGKAFVKDLHERNIKHVVFEMTVKMLLRKQTGQRLTAVGYSMKDAIGILPAVAHDPSITMSILVHSNGAESPNEDLYHAVLENLQQTMELTKEFAYDMYVWFASKVTETCPIENLWNPAILPIIMNVPRKSILVVTNNESVFRSCMTERILCLDGYVTHNIIARWVDIKCHEFHCSKIKTLPADKLREELVRLRKIWTAGFSTTFYMRKWKRQLAAERAPIKDQKLMHEGRVISKGTFINGDKLGCGHDHMDGEQLCSVCTAQNLKLKKVFRTILQQHLDDRDDTDL